MEHINNEKKQEKDINIKIPSLACSTWSKDSGSGSSCSWWSTDSCGKGKDTSSCSWGSTDTASL